MYWAAAQLQPMRERLALLYLAQAGHGLFAQATRAAHPARAPSGRPVAPLSWMRVVACIWRGPLSEFAIAASPGAV